MSTHVRTRLRTTKTEAEKDRSSPERFRGVSPLSDSMMSEEVDNGVMNGFISYEMQHDSPGERGISPHMYESDLERTLGEILGYCQVTYGAILKLEEKFDMLQAKVSIIQTIQQSQSPLFSQGTRVSSAYPGRSESLPTPDLSMPHPISSPSLPSLANKKPHTQFPSPDNNKLFQIDIQNQTHKSTEEPSPKRYQTDHQQRRMNGSTRISTDQAPANTSYVGNPERKVFLPNSVLHKAGKMPRPSSSVRYLLRNMFTIEQLSESSTTGNQTRHLKRLDPNKINAIREWAVKRYPKFDLQEKGKEWKICLSVINSTARYFRFVMKTRKKKLNTTKRVRVKEEDSSALTAEIDVELSESETEQKPPQDKINSKSVANKHAEMNFDSETCNLVYIGSPHRDVKIPDFALSAAHMRPRPELVARYLIKFIFPEDVLIRSNVYGARQGVDPLDHNKVSALREHLSVQFPHMNLEENGCDWKVCVGAINCVIRKFRYDRKMGIKRGAR